MRRISTPDSDHHIENGLYDFFENLNFLSWRAGSRAKEKSQESVQQKSYDSASNNEFTEKRSKCSAQPIA